MEPSDARILEGLLDYALTDSERIAIEEVIAAGGIRAAALAADKSHAGYSRKIARVKARAAMKGYAPEFDMVHRTPAGFHVKGVSTYYDEEGKPKGQWVKSNIDRERQLEIARDAIAALCEDLPRAKPVQPHRRYDKTLMNVIPWGDPHFGMYAWADEAGADYDVDIARNDLCAAAANLIARAPECERLIFVNLGDFFHADNFQGMTARSGNVLDMDTRLPRVYRIGVAAVRQCIDSSLRKFRTVEIVNTPGNHDDVLSMTLDVLLDTLYEREPRVTVHSAPTRRHYFQHGKVMVGAVHGDMTKDNQLPGIMAAEQPEMWGQTRFRYWYRGHHHHDGKLEYPGCIVEQFRTLAAGDAYAVGAGYLSGRDMKCITHHREYGEVGRLICGIDMLRAAA